MTFAKVQKLCSGAPAGFQTFNGLADNEDSLKGDVELEHVPLSAGDPSQTRPDHSTFQGGYTPQADQFSSSPGTHESPLISRGVAVVQQVTTADPTIVTSYGVQLTRAAGCIKSMVVLATGIYFFPIFGFSKVWGKATPHIEAASLLTGLAVDARVNASTDGLTVKTFRLTTVGGHDELTAFHTGFYLVAYGRRTDPTAQVGARLPPRAMALNPRNGMRPTPFLAHQQTVVLPAPPAASNAMPQTPPQTPVNGMRPFPFLSRKR